MMSLQMCPRCRTWQHMSPRGCPKCDGVKPFHEVPGTRSNAGKHEVYLRAIRATCDDLPPGYYTRKSIAQMTSKRMGMCLNHATVGRILRQNDLLTPILDERGRAMQYRKEARP